MTATAEKQLAAFMAAYTPAIASTARAARAKLRALLPGATELVYDNYNALVIGYGPGEKTSEAIVSLALYPKWVTLFFLQNGPALPDPAKRLEGAGTRVRSVRLASAATLDEPDVRALIDHAVRLAIRPIDAQAAPLLIIKSVSPTQRPRRPS
jgi:hypothetical protein